MKLALHRSLTFWSGLLVIAFVAWAWRDSYTTNSKLVYRSRGIALTLGGITISQNTTSGAPMAARLPQSSIYQNFSREWFQRPYSIRGKALELRDDEEPSQYMEEWHRWWISSQPRNVRLTRVPLWLPLLAFIALWLGLLFWRARRRRRVIAL